MRKRDLVASGVGAFVMAATLGAPALAVGQTPSRDAVQEAARKASFRTWKKSRQRCGKPSSRKRRKPWRGSTIPARSLFRRIPEDPVGPSRPARLLHHRHVYAPAAPPQRREAAVRRTRPSAHSQLRPTPTRTPIRPLFTTTGKSSGWRRGRVRFDRTCAPPWSSARRRGRFLR